MPVDTDHPAYTAAQDGWRRIRDCLGGEEAVKVAGSLYLPRLGGQDDGDYAAYLGRAMFYGAAARTLDGLAGAVFRKPPVIAVPEALRPLTTAATPGAQPLDLLARTLVRELLALGRFGILVDPPEAGGLPALAGYAAESIVNWRAERGSPVLVVLDERTEEAGPDPFAPAERRQRRVLRLEDGRYVQELWRPRADGRVGWLLAERTEPTRRGRPLDLIPFLAAGPAGLDLEIARSPLLDLVDVNLSHYRTSADLEHGAHFTALPTVWVNGLGEADGLGDPGAFLRVGAGTAWLLPPGASAGLLEYRGQGLQALETRLARKEQLLAALGARLLEGPKAGVEAAETVRLRHSGETSMLASLADAAGRALARALAWAAWWVDADASAIAVALNKDFLDAPLDATALQALVAGWQAGAYPTSVLRWNLRRGELIPPEMADADLDAELTCSAVPETSG